MLLSLPQGHLEVPLETQVGGGGLGHFGGPDRTVALLGEEAWRLPGSPGPFSASLAFARGLKPMSLSLSSLSLGITLGVVLCSVCAGFT